MLRMNTFVVRAISTKSRFSKTERSGVESFYFCGRDLKKTVHVESVALNDLQCF